MRQAAIGVLVLWLGTAALAQNTSALINEALDKQCSLDLKATLPNAMSELSNKTGVPIKADPAVWDLLPWGEQTNITAKIENQTLRQSLHIITRKLGLSFVLKDEAVEIQPMPALKRLGRRSTVQELQALDLLAATSMPSGQDINNVQILLSIVDASLESMKSPFAIENRTGNGLGKSVIHVPRNATLMEAMEAMAGQTDCTWYPWGKSIVVIHKDDLNRALLGKTISVRFNGVDIGQVLIELAKVSGVDFSIEPGAILRIPSESRNIRLILDNASILQAMESIAGFTGLGYTVNERGVYVWNPAAVPPGRRDRVAGIITLNNGLQVLLPESQVPPDLREYIQLKTQKQLDKLRVQMNTEGFKPATRPTTTPADENL